MAVFFDWSTTPASNTTVNGVSIAEGCPAANMNNAVREVMAAARNTFSSSLQTFLAGSSSLGIAYGGTGLASTPTNGQLLIGNGTGYSLATITAGSNVTITNSAGGITIAASDSSGVPTTGGGITSTSANAFYVGPNGTTNPTFNVDASTASAATGINIKSAAAGGGVVVSVISSGTNEPLTIKQKGSATITLGDTSTTGIVLNTNTTSSFTLSNAKLALSSTSIGAPVVFPSAASNRATSSGTLDFDGNAFYAAVTTSNPGVVAVSHIIYQQADYTLTSQTAAQQAFNSTAAGTLTLTPGTHEFEALISLTTLSATSGSFGFALGGTATITQGWYAEANKVATASTATAPQTSYNTAANTALATANTNTNGYMKITGTITVTVAGTVIPQVSLGVANAAVVKTGSFFKIRRLGSTSVSNVGDWS